MRDEVENLPQPPDDGYKWIALSNTTIGISLATINNSILLISLPAIFRGIDLDPLAPGNVGYLLWMLMGYMVITAVLVVSLAASATCSGGSRCTTSGSRSSRSAPSPARSSSGGVRAP